MAPLITSAPSLLEQAYKTYIQDKAKLGNIGYPAYPGSTTVPMSYLTQRAREYQQRFANKGLPYENKLQTVLNKPRIGLSPDQTQRLLDTIRGTQQRAADLNLQALRNQFGPSLTPQQIEAYGAGTQQDIGRGIGEFSGKLQDLSREAGSLEGNKIAALAKTLEELRAAKQARRQGLISNLEQFGNQKHTLANMINNAERAKFMQEAESPYRRLEELGTALEPLRNRLAGDQLHPDLNKMTAMEIKRALDRYNAGYTPYPGKTVASATPEMEASYNLLGRIHPSIKDTYAAERKNIIGGFLRPETTMGRALENVPARMESEMNQLEADARRRMQEDLAAINNRYVRLGQHGSPQHIGEAAKRAQEINKAFSEFSNKSAEKTLGNQFGLQHREEIGNLERLKRLAALGQQEFQKGLGDIRQLNRLGATKWRNQQDEHEDMYRNFQNQLNWGYPQTPSNVNTNEIFGRNIAPGLQLEDLNNIRTNYSEMINEGNQPQSDIRTTQQMQGAQQNAIREAQQQSAAQQAQQFKQRLDSYIPQFNREHSFAHLRDIDYAKNIQMPPPLLEAFRGTYRNPNLTAQNIQSLRPSILGALNRSYPSEIVSAYLSSPDYQNRSYAWRPVGYNTSELAEWNKRQFGH